MEKLCKNELSYDYDTWAGILYLLSIASSTSTRSEDKVKFLTVPPLYANT